MTESFEHFKAALADKRCKKLREICNDFLEFWVWEPQVDRGDYSHYDFRNQWVIAMADQEVRGSFFLPDIDFFLDLDQIGDCWAVGIHRPKTP